jgi:hypothetical protein
MNSFRDSVLADTTVTDNGMKTNVSSLNKCVDLFYTIGSMRGKDPLPKFIQAFVEDKDIALKLSLWARDVRGGAGERQVFRDILKYLDEYSPEDCKRLLPLVSEVGRWDDLLVVTRNKQTAFTLIKNALQENNKLCAKWMPRKGELAKELMQFLNLNPKQYRKLLVNITEVVETKMCSKQWDNIEFGKVPSVASKLYRKAFARNSSKYADYLEGLEKGTKKANAGALYPYGITKPLLNNPSKEEVSLLEAQWKALPNYLTNAKILPMVDVSGSMSTQVSDDGLEAIDVAISLGLYISDKTKSVFKDMFLTFSENSKFVTLEGTLAQKAKSMERADWGMSTNLESAFREILRVAIANKLPQSEMPEYLLILSDMQFNEASRRHESALENVQRHYAMEGYELPKIVFWNLVGDSKGVPARHNDNRVALVSGFSPAILKAILSDPSKFTPESIMLQALSDSRYNLNSPIDN